MAEKTKTFEELNVWQKAHAFVLCVYKSSEAFPKKEDYGLTSQFRRSAVSIAANIAEGYRKRGKADKLRFFNIAQGSLEESRDYVILSKDLGYINSDVELELYRLIEDTSRLLNGYCKAIISGT